MKDTFGSSVSLTIAGESHGKGIIAILSGMSPGIYVNEDRIREELEKRRPKGDISTARQELDLFEIMSGVFQNHTTGTPITIFIPNASYLSDDYKNIKYIARPGHADYTAQIKYDGFQDPRGGGHFSGRVTAGIVAAGAICRQALYGKGIKIGTHILECAGVRDRTFDDVWRDVVDLNCYRDFPVIDEENKQKMMDAILAAKADCDSVGGIVETAINGLPAGIGEPYFESIESRLSQILFSIPAIKGVEFGEGFGFAKMRGSEANDEFYYDEAKEVHTKTNHNGGINGGISNGEDIIFRCAVKPTPSIAKEQDSINYVFERNEKLEVKGRHDPCIVHRVCAVVNAASAIAICDLLSQHYGTNYFQV